MDEELFDMIHEDMPKLNPLLANGYAVEQLKSNEEYLDRVWKQAEAEFPDELTYAGYVRCTPDEEYERITKKKTGSKRIFDISRSDVYMVHYRFNFKGQEIPDLCYVWLPYLSQGGIMTIKRSKCVISPVLADVGLSVCADSIFVRWNRARLTFRKCTGYVTVNGVRSSADMVWAQIYNTSVKRSLKYNTTTLTHYLFAKYGVIDTFKRMGVDVIGMNRLDYSSTKYPPEEFTVYSTPSFQVSGKVRQGKQSIGSSNVTFVVPNSQVTPVVTSMMACFFYVADQDVNYIDGDHFDYIQIWRKAIGKMVLPETSSLRKALDHMETHIGSVDGYLDNMAKESLISIGITHVNDVYDLFYYLNENLPRKVAEAGRDLPSMYGKRLTVNAYVDEDITYAISTIFFNLRREIKKPKHTGFDAGTIKRIFSKDLKYDRILALNSGKAFVKSVSSASDCLIHKVTSSITMQTECGNSSGSKKRQVFTEEQHAHISNIELGAITNLPDRDTTGRSSLNHMAIVEPDGTLTRNPAFVELLDEVQAEIERQ